ncbi:hypothetical protein ACFFX0_11395 [Citricoccus parietis]|uniref:Uncharacterized protein n=1 Tax=Citricoccus parietis TaxID=592307 RepID=A0ABV5FYL2_9MICC
MCCIGRGGVGIMVEGARAADVEAGRYRGGGNHASEGHTKGDERPGVLQCGNRRHLDGLAGIGAPGGVPWD